MFLIANRTNLALRKWTTQSSDYTHNTISSKAVDGVTLSGFDYCMCTGSSDVNPWWMVDLGSLAYVSWVTFINRGDCCRK